jgi:hypothetical protein
MKTDVNTLQLNEIFPRSSIPYLFVFLKKKISNLAKGAPQYFSVKILQNPKNPTNPNSNQKNPSKTQNHSLNNITASMNLLLRNHQRRSKTDDIAVGRFCQQAIFGKLNAHIPSRVAVFGVIYHDSVQ